MRPSFGRVLNVPARAGRCEDVQPVSERGTKAAGCYSQTARRLCFSSNQERFMRSYHERSNVECTFGMIKPKFGGRLRSKTEVAQTTEVLRKVLCPTRAV